MEQFRLLLAVVAALLAAVFFGVWWVKGRQRSNRRRAATLSYALLLLCSAAFLFLRARQPQTVDAGTIVPERTAERNMSSSIRPQRDDSVRVDTLSQPQSSHNGKAFETTRSAELMNRPATSGEAPRYDVVTSVEKRRDPYIGPPLLELPKRKRATSKAPEEVVESVVLDAFDIIELFFEKYGSPAPGTAGMGG